MPKRSSRDLNQTAYDIVRRSTEMADKAAASFAKGAAEKNPAAVALGRLGGLKGGSARAAALSARRRKEIARRAAAARWKKK